MAHDGPMSDSKKKNEGQNGTQETDLEQKPLPVSVVPLWNNVITITGMYIGLMALILLMTFGLFSLISPASNPYLDVFGYLVVPSLMGGGVALLPIGILIKSWRIHRKNPDQKVVFRFPRINLNDPGQRRLGLLGLGGTVIFLPILGVSSYHGYHYTDSTDFCAKACHEVMSPQATTHSKSSHARVSCGECHIGSGASWFVKAKLSGTRQVWAVMTGDFSRPIPPAIRHLRPAGDTCEQCHWPQKFFGSQLKNIPHFAADESNTRREIKVLINTGGADESRGQATGIHLHMLMGGAIEYVAVDDSLQHIPWVRWVDNLGEELIYRSDGLSAKDPKPEGRLRSMDCMDCHNRPAHKFRAPDQALNIALEIERIDRTLPFIKREAMAALAVEYPNEETARLEIVNHIIEFYRRNYAERYEESQEVIRQAAEKTADIYRENIFPLMRVNWQTYPDNIGHMVSPGCFRCHDGKHVNQYDVPISHDCNVCHSFLNPVGGGEEGMHWAEGEFVHSLEFPGLHDQLRCDQCHTGGKPLVPTCQGCHEAQDGLYTASSELLDRFEIGPNPMTGSVDCEGCHELAEPVTLENMDAMCMDCHDDEEERYEGMLAGWSNSVTAAEKKAQAAVDKLAAALAAYEGEEAQEARQWLDQNQAILDMLKKANPLHNTEGSIRIYEVIAPEAAQQEKSLGVVVAGG